VHVSCLKESRNALSYRHLTFHMILSPLLVVLLVVEKVKLERPRFTMVSVSETENGDLFMTQNAAARVRPLRSRIGRPAWSFPSLNLSRS
jgi:hypothetical protein